MKYQDHKTKLRGNNRELYHTRIQDIHLIVKSILEHYPFLSDYLWIDPCAGDGVWSKVFEHYKIQYENYDIVPLNDKVKQKDFLQDSFEQYKNKKVFFIGNPPFTLVDKFIEKALSISDYCYFLGGSSKLTGKISNKVDMLHRFEGYNGNQKDLRTKLLFITTNNEEVPVWTCGALCSNKEHKQFTIYKNRHNGFDISPVSSCSLDDNRIICIKNEKMKLKWLSKNRNSVSKLINLRLKIFEKDETFKDNNDIKIEEQCIKDNFNNVNYKGKIYQNIDYAIIENENNKEIGVIGYFNKDGDYWLDWFGILKDERQKGYGSKAINLLENYLIKKGVKTIRLYANNINAINLYKELGFEKQLETQLRNNEQLTIMGKSLINEKYIEWKGVLNNL